MYGNMRAGEGGEEKVSSIGAAARPVARLRYFFFLLHCSFPVFLLLLLLLLFHSWPPLLLLSSYVEKLFH